MSNDLTTREQFPAPLFTPTPKAAKRMLEFFTAQINNPHTRRAYLNAARRFAAWCRDHRIGQLAEVQPVHVAAFIQDLQGQLAPATVKQHLAALRVLFDWLVTGHILQLNPAHAVRGPKYSLKKGKTPVLTAEEARALLDSIRTVRTVQHGDETETREPLLVGLRAQGNQTWRWPIGRRRECRFSRPSERWPRAALVLSVAPRISQRYAKVRPSLSLGSDPYRPLAVACYKTAR